MKLVFLKRNFRPKKLNQSPPITESEKNRPEAKMAKEVEERIEINDKLVRIIGIQFFGIVIPNATGLVNNDTRSVPFLVLTYAYFIFIAFMIWQGNRWILFKLESKYNWFINPAQKLILILGGNIFYTGPLVVSMVYGWYQVAGVTPDWDVIKVTAFVCIVCVIFVTHTYETIFLIKQRESDKIRQEKLERAKAQVELQVLKNQIDPHFMFNSLNSLSHLIEKEPPKAKVFTESLAEVYRYILSNKDQKLVFLEDEIAFLNKYIDMLKIRFKDSLIVHQNFVLQDQKHLIPPISIFIALENVVKHNEISTSNPMEVLINLDEDFLNISNAIKPKKSMEHSSKIGLTNLNERFRILVGKEIVKTTEHGIFKLKLPLLTVSN